MIPRSVRDNACKGLSAAFAEGVDIHPDVKPIAQKLCGGLDLSDADRVKISLFHTQFAAAEPDGRRDELRYLQMGGFEAIAWAFPPAVEPPPVEMVDPDGVLAQLASAIDTPIEFDAAEVTQPRLDTLSERLSAIDDRLRARIDGVLALTLRVAAGKVGVQLARYGTKLKSLPPEAKELHDELGNSLEFLQAAKPETAGLIRTWALAALSVSEEDLAIAELDKVPDEILPAFVTAGEDKIDAIAEELDLDRAQVAEYLEPRQEEDRRSVLEYLAAIGPALVLGRLNAGSNGATIRPDIHTGIVDDIIRVGGGADFNPDGSVPISDNGNLLRNGVEMEGDLFGHSDATADVIETVDGTRPGYDKTFSHADKREGATRRDKDPNPLHIANHGRPQAETTATPQRNRGCDCRWETTLQAAGFEFTPAEFNVALYAAAVDTHVCAPSIDMATITKVIMSIEKREGWEIRTELWNAHLKDEPTEMKSGYTLEGHYIGDVETAKYLVEERGIAPQLKRTELTVCSIGFNEAEQKWYGWSHRAIYGFGIGDKINKGDVIAGDDSDRVGLLAKTLEDAKLFAIWFADGVS